MLDEHVTILVPTSPIPRHPDTSLIDECIGAIRYYFPTARLIIMADGVRPQVEHRREQYQLYKAELQAKIVNSSMLELCYATEFEHQAGLTQKFLSAHGVETPLVLFVEHDAILRREPAIEWAKIFDLLLHDKVNMIRLYNWEKAPWHEHEYLMRGSFDYEGVNYIRTVQFSGWPFVCQTNYLKRLLDENVRGRYAMIETVAYGPVAGAPWDEHRIVIYAPEDAHTFIHRDGRTDEVTGQRDPADW